VIGFNRYDPTKGSRGIKEKDVRGKVDEEEGV